MPGDGQIKVGMQFGTVKSATNRLIKTEKAMGGKVTSRNCGTVGGLYGERSGNQVDYSNNGKMVNYHASIGGVQYSGSEHVSRIKNNDEIMNKKFTHMSNEEGTQYAVDKNGNGVVDADEIHDCMWGNKF